VLSNAAEIGAQPLTAMRHSAKFAERGTGFRRKSIARKDDVY
jgi:hypothetical protein